MTHSEQHWTLIDDFAMEELYHLKPTDVCYYYLVHVPGGYTESDSNSRISNFQKHICHKGSASWNYRQQEIKSFAHIVAEFLNKQSHILNEAALVPIFTSSPKRSDTYNDRLVELAIKVVTLNPHITLEDVFDVSRPLSPAKAGGPRHPDELRPFVTFRNFTAGVPKVVFLIDDVITSGSHYRICSDIIREQHPEIMIIGLFLARHINPE